MEVTVKKLIEILSLMEEDMPVKIEDENRSILNLKGVVEKDDQDGYEVVLSVYSNHENK